MLKSIDSEKFIRLALRDRNVSEKVYLACGIPEEIVKDKTTRKYTCPICGRENGCRIMWETLDHPLFCSYGCYYGNKTISPIDLVIRKLGCSYGEAIAYIRGLSEIDLL